MTTQELINQYVTAHADNRWMDASELEALLTNFAEEMQEQMMKDAIDTRIDKRLADMIGYTGSERVKVIIIKE